MRQLLKWMRWIAAAAVVTTLVLLAWQCIDIYMEGSVDVNSGIYRWEDVCARLQSIAVPMIFCGGVCAVTGLLNILPFLSAPETSLAHYQKSAYKRPKATDCPRIVRIVILFTAVVFIVLGVMNGGLRDVLIKAINICTECIGLG